MFCRLFQAEIKSLQKDCPCFIIRVNLIWSVLLLKLSKLCIFWKSILRNYSKSGHCKMKWNSSSITLGWHSEQIRSSNLILRNLPSSIFNGRIPALCWAVRDLLILDKWQVTYNSGWILDFNVLYVLNFGFELTFVFHCSLACRRILSFTFSNSIISLFSNLSTMSSDKHIA